ncbi:DUF3159 domain-containing protein [Kribbella shirazensis]|uniref:DUF3159 domain-containing protein n=1 Tax=Kribbella shirazensis TaxID=1105143 RepID=A0A7X5VF79_9ACTN|nr:DUF3159 domain-containing protein [Kribbella shirazensis]NIK60131.1 hypothetical protein [Kribbella shirazensis]
MAEPGRETTEDAPAADRPASKTTSQGIGSWVGMLVDVGLPWIAFTMVYGFSDHNLKLALIVALSAAGVVALFRLVRRKPIASVIAGFIGVGISAWTANKTGQAQDAFLPGILLNAGYGLLYFVTIVTRYPLFGLLYGVITQTWLAWRQDADLFRGLNRVTIVFAAQVAIRLSVMVPLYLAHNVNALGIAKIALGLPFYALTLWVAYKVLRGSMPPEKWDEVKDTFAHMLRGTQPEKKREEEKA